MERVRSLLRVLLHRALSEHGRDAPSLTGITIERASDRFGPRIGAHFDNGYCTWAPIRPDDCYPVCERYRAWDLPSLRGALLCEAQELYPRMRAQHLAELGLQRERRGVAGIFERFRRRTSRGGAREADGEGEQQRSDRGAGRGLDTQRRLLEWWALQRTDFSRSALLGDGFCSDIGSKRAQERGLKLLKENLTSEQRKQYEKYGYFDVTGGRTGKRYRIRHGRQMNIEQLDRNGRRVCGWCFFPQGNLVSGDIMLAQKAALELFESDALRIANRF